MEQEGTLSRHLTGRRSFSRDPSKTDKLSHRVDQATPLQWAGRYINLSSKPEYFAILSLIARSAAAPASLAVAATIRINHHTYGRDVPGQRFASLPRNQCEAVCHLTALNHGFLRTRDTGRGEIIIIIIIIM